MTPKAQRIAIAEACGWRRFDSVFETVYYPPNPHPIQNIYGHTLPDYLNDLNAMHEAEKACIVGNYKVCNGDTSIESAYRLRIGVFSTAPQRAEAFLRTIGKWKEDNDVKAA